MTIEEFKQFRNYKSLSQKQISEDLGIDRLASISEIENGKQKITSVFVWSLVGKYGDRTIKLGNIEKITDNKWNLEKVVNENILSEITLKSSLLPLTKHTSFIVDSGRFLITSINEDSIEKTKTINGIYFSEGYSSEEYLNKIQSQRLHTFSSINHIDEGLTNTVELLSILKWKYGYFNQEEEFNSIEEISNHKGNWGIIFKERPSVKLLLSIIIIFDSDLSYDGLDFIQYDNITINGLAGCLAEKQKLKISNVLTICK